MDELAQARVELTLLEEKAQQLLKQLLDVRATIATQRARIDGLSRTSLRPSTINRLPTEILVFILDLDVHTHDYLDRKQELASVCRRWRDVILQTPCFWSTIYVPSDASSINIHLERSRGTLLDIVIECAPFAPPNYLALPLGLDIVMACAHRWCSLLVTEAGDYSFDCSSDHPEEEGEEMLTGFIADRINHLHFPSLKSATISLPCDLGFLGFLSVAHAPALEHLELDNFITKNDILNPVAMLKTLKLDFDMGYFIDYPLCWSLVPTQALTKLSLCGETKLSSLEPSSLYFPSLMSLEMVRVTKIGPILDAIVAPNLEQVNCSHCDESLSDSLSGFGSKFTNVRQLSFSRSGRWGLSELSPRDTMRFCEAFPGVHHVELDGGDWPYIFYSPWNRFEESSNSHIQCPMDLWTELKSLTFNGLDPLWQKGSGLFAWLDRRRASSPQQLHVKVKRPHPTKVDQSLGQHSIRPYERMKEYCILELDGFSSTDFSVPEDSSSRGVSSFHITSHDNSTHLDLTFTGANKASGQDRRSLLSWRRWSWVGIVW